MANMKHLIGGFVALGLLAGGSAIATQMGANTAHAQSSAKATVDAAIRRGEVGEQIDGYLGIVDGANPSADVRAAVSEINISRKAVYTDLAQQQNVQPAVVAQLTGEKQVKKAAGGTYIKDASGSWKQK